MKEFFNSSVWFTLVLFLLGILSVFTREIVTFTMLGFIIIILSNIYDKLDDIYKKSDKG